LYPSPVNITRTIRTDLSDVDGHPKVQPLRLHEGEDHSGDGHQAA
jgi:hypothetical protein